jgi:hypothetical protein
VGCRLSIRRPTRRGTAFRHRAIGRHGSLAVVERAIGTLKREGLRRILVPFCIDEMQREVGLLVGWHNEHRPHQALDGATPNEVFEELSPANQSPRIEPRPNWPRPSSCAAPRTLVAGQPGDQFDLVVAFVEGRRHLPVVSLRRAA